MWKDLGLGSFVGKGVKSEKVKGVILVHDLSKNNSCWPDCDKQIGNTMRGMPEFRS